MKTPYLIQRLNFRKPTTTGSFDEVLQCDYMGSSEFEWGALPKSLKQMTKNFKSLTVNVFKDAKNYKLQKLCIISDPEKAKLYFNNYYEKLALDEIHLKELSRLDNSVFGTDWKGQPIKENDWSIVDAWWDIENQVMFTFGKNNAESILNAIKNTLEKKKKDNQSEWY